MDAVISRQEVIEVGAPLVLALQVGEVARNQIDEWSYVDVAATQALEFWCEIFGAHIARPTTHA